MLGQEREAGVEYQLRETLESALVFGNAVLLGLGVEATEAAETIADVRRRDEARLQMQIMGGIKAGNGADPRQHGDARACAADRSPTQGQGPQPGGGRSQEKR
jgi:hypothetical protein